MSNDSKETPTTSDQRFNAIQRDPRFIRPKKRDMKVKIDSRFAHMLDNKEFDLVQTVDKYGRPVREQTNKRNLKNFYEIEEHEQAKAVDADAEADPEIASQDDSAEISSSDIKDFKDFARGKVVASDSEDESASDHDSEASVDSEDNQNELEEEDAADLQEKVLRDRDVPHGEPTKRFAVVNMDWDNVSAMSLFQLFDGFKPSNSLLKHVTIYPSEFGKERLAIEEVQGPPSEIFKPLETEESANADLLADDNSHDKDFDQDNLRKYQLGRLKYYYAVAEFDSVRAAKTVYNQCEGTEYEHSSVTLDLRYIPDDMDFSDTPKDRAAEVTPGFAPRDFVTPALQQSEVKLTWDEDDADRLTITQRKFTKDDIKALDFQAYLASSEEDTDDEANTKRERYKALLAAADDSDNEDDRKPTGDMEITFAPGLSEKANKLLESKKLKVDNDDETVFEQYLRTKKEKRKISKKEKRHATVAPFSDDEAQVDMEDEFFADTFDETFEAPKNVVESSSDEKVLVDEQDVADETELSLLMMDESNGGIKGKRHFDMKEIEKAAKKNKRHGKKPKKDEVVEVDTFQVDVKDDRFSSLFTSPQYALDPTNSKFKKSKSVDEIMREKRRRIKNSDGNLLQSEKSPAKVPATPPTETASVKSLVDKIKKSSATASLSGKRKKQKTAE